MTFAPFAVLFVLSGPVGAAAAAEPAAPRLRHRLAVSPDEIRAFDTRTLAEALVDRIRRECDLAGGPRSGEKVLGDAPALIVMVPAEALDSIARDGLLNQHETLTSGGSRRERERFESEQELAMLRLPFDFKGRELLPKYAVVDAARGGLGAFRLPVQYGGVAIVFKPGVAARATWTYADSLDYSRKAGRFDRGGAGNTVLTRTFGYERKQGDRNACGNYCEAQIWGELSLRDAAYLMVRDSEPYPAAAARLGISVYDYAVSESSTAVLDAGRTAQYVRGALRPAPAAGAPPEPPGVGERNFRESLAFSKLDDAALAEAFESASDRPDQPGGFSPRQRLLGELAARPKSDVVVRALEKAFAAGDPDARALALYGLSELSWEKFKPRLLEGLGSASGPLLISAVAFAADHRDDADVAARLDALRRAPGSEAAEWVERPGKARFCDP